MTRTRALQAPDEPQVHELWHALSVAETERLTHTRASGLTAAEASQRGSGGNRIAVGSKRPLSRVILSQFIDPLVLVLLAAAVVSALATREFIQTSVILVLVGVNAALGASQEWRASRSLDALQRTVTHSATVLRSGRPIRIPASDLVVGDVVSLTAGDRIPADLRLVEAPGLETDESTLTGESRAIDKNSHQVDAATDLADRACMAYTSTFVRRGRARGVVVAIGPDTEFGRIAALTAGGSRPPTPLQRQLARLGIVVGASVGILSAVLVVVGLIQGRPPVELMLLAVALAVSAIPEGLVAVSAIVLARGVRRMARQGAIIRTLPTVETLGAVDVICVDKTGTLTENSLRVVDAWQPDGGTTSATLVRAAAWCNDAEGSASADPLEAALLEWALVRGAPHSLRRGELAFDPVRRRMSTAHPLSDGTLEIFTKGGLEEVLTASRQDPARDRAARAAHDRMAARGLKVIAFARGEAGSLVPPGDWEHDLKFLGLVALEDPPRAGAAEAIGRARAAGISVIMVTGDHATTAMAIADRIGLGPPDRMVVTGADVDRATDGELRELVPSVGVFARTTPESKMRIVAALQSRRSIVAMTGDGVNDGPALSAADVGCAMGLRGTDVAREAAGLVVTDDHLETVVEAVAEGRRTHDNLTKVVEFLLSTNAGELLLIVVSVLAGLAAPMTPVQILVVNLLTDGGPALALAADPPALGIMRRPPRRSALLTRRSGLRIAIQGTLFAASAMLSFSLAGGADDLESARTAAFLTLSLTQLVHAFSVRTTAFAFGPSATRSPALLWVVLGTAAVSIGIIYLPGVNEILTLRPLDVGTLGSAVALALVPFVIVECVKALRRRMRPTTDSP